MRTHCQPTVFANSAIFVFGALQVRPFNLYVDQTAQLFGRFIFVVCTDIKSISQYHFVF